MTKEFPVGALVVVVAVMGALIYVWFLQVAHVCSEIRDLKTRLAKVETGKEDKVDLSNAAYDPELDDPEYPTAYRIDEDDEPSDLAGV